MGIFFGIKIIFFRLVSVVKVDYEEVVLFVEAVVIVVVFIFWVLMIVMVFVWFLYELVGFWLLFLI